MHRFELSKYEFKNDLTRLKEMSDNYGVYIDHDDYMVYLTIANKNLYDKYYPLFFSFYYLNRFIFNDNDVMLSLIISSMILMDDVFSVDKFSEMIGYSKSALRRPIKMARELLDSHGIGTQNKPYYGLCAKGNEFYIRKCLSSIYIKLVPDLFCEDKTNQNIIPSINIRYYDKIVSEYLNKKGIIAHSNDRKSVAHYLAVTKARIVNNKFIEEIPIANKLIESVKNNGELLTLAIELLNLIDVELDEKELNALMLILLNHNFSIQSSREYVNTFYAKEFYELRENIYYNFYNHYGLTINSSNYTNAIDEEIVLLIIKQHTGDIDKIVHRALGETPNVYAFPLIYFINNSVCRIVKEYYKNEKISPAVTENISDIIYYYIDALPYSHKAYSIGIMSRYSSHTPKMIRDKLLKDIDSSYLEKVDIINEIGAYDINQYKENYDLILTDISVNNLDRVLLYSDFNSSTLKLENYLRLHRNLCACLGEEKFDVVAKNINAKNEDELVENLAKNSPFSEKDIKKGIIYSYILKENLVIYLPLKDEGSMLLIGDLSQTITINNRKVSKYIVFKGKITADNAKILNTILNELVIDPMFMEQLKISPSVETINDMINMIIK